MQTQLVELTREDSLRRLAEAPYGRIVFTERAMPAIRPINHIVVDETVIVRTRLGTSPLCTRGVVVAYQADDIDPVEHRGWSVTVTGLAAPVWDSEEATRFEQLLRPWANGHNEIIRIEPRFIVGYRLG